MLQFISAILFIYILLISSILMNLWKVLKAVRISILIIRMQDLAFGCPYILGILLLGHLGDLFVVLLEKRHCGMILVHLDNFWLLLADELLLLLMRR